VRLSIVGPVYPYRGGIAHYTMHLARKLIACGHEIQVISFYRQYPAWLYPGESDKDPSDNPMIVPAEYLLAPLLPWTWVKAARRIREFEPDIVVIQWWTTFWAPAFWLLAKWLRNRGLQVIYMIHNVLPN
jgi:glycosyltransferase involved in cell wall biosynthesis